MRRLLPPNVMQLLLLVWLLASAPVSAEQKARHFLKKTDSWFASEEGRRTADIILSYQAEEGGWPKNMDTVSKPFEGDPKTLKGTFDNSATTDELRFLALSYHATQEIRYRDAFMKGLGHILNAQYPNGGWPQYFPLPPTYNRHITFNDGAMVRLMNFLKEVRTEAKYAFVPEEQRESCQKAFDKGVQCILRCQIMVNGKPTVWCQQHHEETLLPAGARTYELPSFSGAESVGIVRLLMKVEPSTKEIENAVKSAITWLVDHQIKGMRLDVVPDTNSPTGTDLKAVNDPQAPPLWARFYDLTTGRPYVCDRDGKPKESIAEIGFERRNGYGWYGDWARTLIEQEYPLWKERHP